MKSYYLNRDYILLFAVNLITISVYFLMITIMARFALISFSCSESSAGFAASIFLVGGMLGRIASGKLNDLWGGKATAQFSRVLLILCCFSYYFVGDVSLALLYLIRIVHGFSFALASTVVPAMAVEVFPREKMGEGTGNFMLSMSIGTGVGPLVGLIVADSVNYDLLFMICTILAIICLILTCFVKRGKRDPQRAALSRENRFTLKAFISPNAARFSVFMLIVAFAYGSLNSFLNSYAAELGLAMYAPFTFLIYAAGNVVFRPFCGKMMDRYGENVVMIPAILSMAVGMVLCACVHGPILLLCVGIFMASGFGTCMSTGQAICTRDAGKYGAAIAIGTFFLLCDGGCGIGPLLLGFVIASFGYRIMYLVAAGLCVCACVYYWFEHGRNARQNGNNNPAANATASK